MRFAFIHTHARIFHIVTMCHVLEVSKAGYYAWRARPLSEREQTNRAVTEQIRTIHQRAVCKYTQIPALSEQANSRTWMVREFGWCTSAGFCLWNARA